MQLWGYNVSFFVVLQLLVEWDNRITCNFTCFIITSTSRSQDCQYLKLVIIDTATCNSQLVNRLIASNDLNARIMLPTFHRQWIPTISLFITFEVWNDTWMQWNLDWSSTSVMSILFLFRWVHCSIWTIYPHVQISFCLLSLYETNTNKFCIKETYF